MIPNKILGKTVLVDITEEKEKTNNLQQNKSGIYLFNKEDNINTMEVPVVMIGEDVKDTELKVGDTVLTYKEQSGENINDGEKTYAILKYVNLLAIVK